MTVVVLALDALDAGLVEYFDATEFELESSKQIQTFAHSKDNPYTPEVWATVATGLGPDEHGITGSGTSEWNNSIFEFASRFTGRLDESTRGTLGRFVREKTGEREQIGETDVESIFDRDGAVVHNWPGVHDGSDLQRAWDLMNAVAEGKPKHEFEQELLGLAAQQFGWVREMLHHNVALAGVHIHTLDAAGHAYAEDEESLQRIYQRVAGFVDELVQILNPDDNLLLLSDHGMCTSFYRPTDRDGSPGSHSWRAYASSTTTDVPADVFDVVDWIDEHVKNGTIADEQIDIDEEHLKNLGYI
ncbi:alkaline phosphatase family protein [Halosolutus amylolyticus]|uniref:Alkaline phosphatase family protein n=1 Tax=Halosolutus amylolyticus TaxID=2932267 RepID=A0ABD5PRP9_9EURY|nr:alkaline phosphatase family protein [Halosolutus amylolyticus]